MLRSQDRRIAQVRKLCRIYPGKKRTANCNEHPGGKKRKRLTDPFGSETPIRFKFLYGVSHLQGILSASVDISPFEAPRQVQSNGTQQRWYVCPLFSTAEYVQELLILEYLVNILWHSEQRALV